MENEDAIKRLLQELNRRGIKSTKEVMKDFQKLIGSDINNFVKVFFRDFVRKDFNNYNKFEKLKLTKKQRKRLESNLLRRYEYRNTSNLRCIFIVLNDENGDVPILLCAYNKNIDRAIDIFERVIGG